MPRKLEVPGKVLFTGTVNVDETTYMFSPKVLDRAFTIEFDQVDLEGFAEGASSEDESGLNLDAPRESLDLLQSGSSENDDWKPSREDWMEFSEETGEHQTAILQLHRILEAQHRHFGYRVANEIARFVNLAREQAKDTDAAVDAAFDLAPPAEGPPEVPRNPTGVAVPSRRDSPVRGARRRRSKEGREGRAGRLEGGQGPPGAQVQDADTLRRRR